MFRFILILCLSVLGSFSMALGQESGEYAKYFGNSKGCFLLYNMKTAVFEKEIGGKTCSERVVASSTFKVPLSVMAFDAGLLKDEEEILKWDGVKDARPEVNQDQNARTWMKNSVVWFSQRLTPQLGKERFQQYLKAFHYGNEDISQGLTTAWLVSPSDPGPALKISPYEQAEFMKALWTDALPVSKRAMQITRDITYLETSANGFKLNGKTGSNFYSKEPLKRLGWFIAHISDGAREYIVVTNFSDVDPSSDTSFGGQRAKAIAKQILANQGLWQ